MHETSPIHDPLIIGGVELHSRLFIGTGKYGDDALIPAVCESSASQVITVAMRRVDRGGSGVIGHIPPHMRLLPNTSGARNAQEAVRLARLARADEETARELDAADDERVMGSFGNGGSAGDAGGIVHG